MPRWLALYVGMSGRPRAAIVAFPESTDGTLGIDEFELGLVDFDGEPVTLVKLPDDPQFYPIVFDITDGIETDILPLQI